MEGLCDVVGCGVSQWETRGKAAYGLWVSETRRQVRARKAKGVESSEMDLMETIRAFSGGLAVGSEGFVEEVFGERRDLFGPKRERGARPLAAELHTLRDLRLHKTTPHNGAPYSEVKKVHGMG
jgi:hypothetical protein